VFDKIIIFANNLLIQLWTHKVDYRFLNKMENLVLIFRPIPALRTPTNPNSRIPIRTANAEKRAREQGLVPEIDETKLSPSELRALR
jgi:hypothetical protein